MRPANRLSSSLLWSILGIVVLCGACSSADDGAIATTGDLAVDLRQTNDVLTPGDSVALTEVTDFDWDTVYFFDAGTKRSVINDRVGVAVFDADLDERVLLFEDGYLAVFTRDGQVVEQSKVPSYFSLLDDELDSAAQVIKTAGASGGEIITISR